MPKFYELAKQHLDTIGGMIETISKSTDMREISELEIKIRKLSAETMVYVGMIPNKDIYPITLERRKAVQSSAVSAVDMVKRILEEDIPKEETPAAPKTQLRKKKIVEKKGKKNGSK